jgi:hypothetical protein
MHVENCEIFENRKSKIDESTNRRIDESTNRRIDESTNRIESKNRRIGLDVDRIDVRMFVRSIVSHRSTIDDRRVSVDVSR